jgi:hypothetical protein
MIEAENHHGVVHLHTSWSVGVGSPVNAPFAGEFGTPDLNTLHFYSCPLSAAKADMFSFHHQHPPWVKKMRLSSLIFSLTHLCQIFRRLSELWL